MTTIVDPPIVRARWLAVTSLAVGSFTVVTSEMLPVGLLTPIGRELGVSDGTAGLLMSAPGLVAAVSAPVLAITTRRVDRRVTLVALMTLLAITNLAAALAPSYPVMLAARVLTGVSIGGFWAFTSGLGVRLVPARVVGRATSIILSGVSVATVLGVPLAAFLSASAGWRAAFAAMGLAALALAVLLLVTLPRLPSTQGKAGPTRLSQPMVIVLVLTVLLVAGHFAGYTYVRPFLEQVAGAGPALVGAALLLYGTAGVIGNFAAGARAGRNPAAVVVALGLLMAAGTLALPLLGTPLPPLVLWGLGYGGVGVALQLWIIREGGGEFGTALFVAAYNISIALGSFAGGRVADGVSVSATVAVTAVLALVSAVVAGSAGRSRTSGS